MKIIFMKTPQAGPLIKVTICKDKEGKPKSFGFVCFKHTESVSYAIALLNGIRLYGRPINVQYRFGSSHSSELNSQSVENYLDVNSQSYRNEEPWDRPAFPMKPFTANDCTLPQEYSFFQKMMNLFLSQQYPMHNPAEQPSYGQMASTPRPGLPMSLSLNPVSDLEAGPSSLEWVQPPPSDSGLYQINKRKRQQQTSDSDSSTEDSKGKRRCGQKYRKCRKKKKRH
uniref:RRM domain-containing protein n=1 Tax=Ornithorhynchus anatinus TaxID=9258 RepID=A0A6I8N8W9_ORNAN